jgi:5-methylthioribose kinase
MKTKDIVKFRLHIKSHLAYGINEKSNNLILLTETIDDISIKDNFDVIIDNNCNLIFKVKNSNGNKEIVVELLNKLVKLIETKNFNNIFLQDIKSQDIIVINKQ